MRESRGTSDGGTYGSSSGGPAPTRRGVLGAGGLGLLAAAVAGCDLASTEPKKPGGRRDGGDTGEGDGGGDEAAGKAAKEAPELASLVRRGKLPPVADRMPDEPLTVEPVDGAGEYGGSWRMGITGGVGSLSQLTRFQGYENLVRWTPDWKPEPIPNVAESFEIEAGGRRFTFTLRDGLRWSDGEPFTVDDIMFWYDDVMSNKDLTPVPPSWMVPADEPGKVERVDDRTVAFTFDQPHGLFLQLLAQPGGDAPVRYAKHYLKQFHQKYNPDAEAVAKDAGASGWVQHFQNKGGSDDSSIYYRAKDLPLLHPWTFTRPPSGAAARAIASRNPFYWKTDTDGRQLPYIDRLDYDFLQGENINTLVLKVLGGEIDMEDQFFATPQNKSVLANGRDKGGYDFFTTTPTETNEAVIQLNLNHKDPVKRRLFQNKDFRIGLSHAINRKQIIDLVFLRQGEPFQSAPRPDSEYYNEQLARQYTEYDEAKANEHLDAAGLTARDGQGFRTWPDGRRISIGMELDSGRLTFVDMAELVTGYWKKVGIELHVRSMERSLWEEKVRTNGDFDVTVHRFGGGSGQAVLLDPRYYFPFNGNSMFAAAWQAWYNDLSGDEVTAGKEKPPAPARRQMRLYDRIKATVDAAERKRLMDEILQIAAAEFYVIGITLQADSYGIVRDDFHNVPDTMPWSYIYPHPAPTNPEQYYVSA